MNDLAYFYNECYAFNLQMPEALLTFSLYGEFITIGRVLFALNY